jgi:hypothetical protein
MHACLQVCRPLLSCCRQASREHLQQLLGLLVLLLTIVKKVVTVSVVPERLVGSVAYYCQKGCHRERGA